MLILFVYLFAWCFVGCAKHDEVSCVEFFFFGFVFDLFPWAIHNSIVGFDCCFECLAGVGCI